VKLVDTTVLSNFACIERLDLLALALPEALVTSWVMAELQQGEATNRLPASDWNWLTVVTLSAEELTHFERIRQVLDDGEASCLAVALVKEGMFFVLCLDFSDHCYKNSNKFFCFSVEGL